MFADVGPDICVCTDVFPQHAGLFAADSTLSAHILAPATTPHIHILFIRFIPDQREWERERGREGGGERERETR